MDEHFQALLDRYFDGALEDADREELEALLLLDREYRVEFWRQAHLIEALRKQGREARGVELAFAPSPPRRKRHRQIGWWAGGLAAAAAAVLTWALLLPSGPEDPATDELAGESAGDGMPLAVVSRASGVEWVEADAPQPGQQISGRTLHLVRGLVAIEFLGGARAVAEGPATFTLLSDSGLKVESGNLQIDVPGFARDFTIELRGTQVISTGGSFDVRAGTAEVELSVSKGHAETVIAGQRRAMQSGEFVLVDGQGNLATSGSRPLPTDPTLAERIERDEAGRLSRWQKASALRSRDPALLVHFRMDARREETGSSLINSAIHPDASRQAPVIAAQWVEGRWPGKRGLAFRNSSDRARIEIRGEHPRVTYAAWVRIDELPRHFNAIFQSESGVVGEVHWQLSAQAEFNFGVKPSKPKPDRTYHRAFSGPIITSQQRGVWKHLATTYDATAREVIHYVDGKEFTRASVPESIPLRFGIATFGNCPMPPNDKYGPRSFGGVIDEFLLYDRALIPDEIQSLYQEGRPD